MVLAMPAPPPPAFPLVVIVIVASAPVRRIYGRGCHDNRTGGVHRLRRDIDRLRGHVDGRRLCVDNARNPNANIDVHPGLDPWCNDEKCAAEASNGYKLLHVFLISERP